LYKGFKRTVSFTGDFVKGSVRVALAPRLEYKGFKFKYNVKGNICRGLLIRTYSPSRSIDGARSNFFVNNAVLIRKKQNIKSKYVFGPVEKNLKRKKLKTLFKTII
jgi:ribosomal protein L14